VLLFEVIRRDSGRARLAGMEHQRSDDSGPIQGRIPVILGEAKSDGQIAKKGFSYTNRKRD
jgi:hypothetical protein